MFVYNSGNGYAMCASPLNKEYGLKKAMVHHTAKKSCWNLVFL